MKLIKSLNQILNYPNNKPNLSNKKSKQENAYKGYHAHHHRRYPTFTKTVTRRKKSRLRRLKICGDEIQIKYLAHTHKNMSSINSACETNGNLGAKKQVSVVNRKKL